MTAQHGPTTQSDEVIRRSRQEILVEIQREKKRARDMAHDPAARLEAQSRAKGLERAIDIMTRIKVEIEHHGTKPE